MLTQDEFLTDPYGALARLYPQAYVGGWNAAEKQDLLDEGTRCLTLCSPSPIPETDICGIPLQVQIMPPELFFGLETIESPAGGYRCSDPEKTIVDLMLYPDLFGDPNNANEILHNYMQRSNKDLKKMQIYFRQAGHPEMMVRFMKEAQ